MRLMLVITLVLLAAPLAGAAPTAGSPEDGCGDADHCGVVAVGLGKPLVQNVDHARFRVPDGAVGIVDRPIIAENPLPARPPLFGLLTQCPPGMACTQDVVDIPCLAVYAPPGGVGTLYAFSWAYDTSEATVLFADMPRHWRIPTPLASAPPTACV